MPNTITNPAIGQVHCAVCKICGGKVWPPSAVIAHEQRHRLQGWRLCKSCNREYQVMPGSKWPRCPACQSKKVKRAHAYRQNVGGRPRGNNYKPRKPKKRKEIAK